LIKFLSILGAVLRSRKGCLSNVLVDSPIFMRNIILPEIMLELID